MTAPGRASWPPPLRKLRAAGCVLGGAAAADLGMSATLTGGTLFLATLAILTAAVLALLAAVTFIDYSGPGRWWSR